LVFEKNANFFAENCQKSQKIVIITSTPDWANFRRLVGFFCLWMHRPNDLGTIFGPKIAQSAPK
jgi:hypothetical protein